jgi:hypothetical protein
MDSKNKLRDNLIRKIKQLPAHKLKQVDSLLDEISSPSDSKQKTLQLAGSWKDLNEELFNDFTSNLHHKRNNDRQII